MENTISLRVLPDGREPFALDVHVKRVGCARNTSRDTGSTQQEVDAIRAEGYSMHGPSSICLKSRCLLTVEDTIEVQGPQTSGEVDYAAIAQAGTIHISVGSDHNDRSLGRFWTPMLGKVHDSAKTKQMVPAMVAAEAWPYDDVKEHWDDIILRSSVTVADRRIPYQEYRLTELLDLEHHLTSCPWLREDGTVLLGETCGFTPGIPDDVFQGQPTPEDVTFPTDFHMEIHDPVLGRTIVHSYDVVSLEEPGSLSLRSGQDAHAAQP